MQNSKTKSEQNLIVDLFTPKLMGLPWVAARQHSHVWRIRQLERGCPNEIYISRSNFYNLLGSKVNAKVKFLVHLSRRLKCAIVITRCPFVVNFLYFQLYRNLTVSKNPTSSNKTQDGRISLRLAETLLTFSLKQLNGIWWNLTRSKYLMSSTNFVFFWTDLKTKITTPVVPLRMVAHCTQEHNMGPFGPLVSKVGQSLMSSSWD